MSDPYYDQDGITIYCGDCREILPTLPKFDLMLTDPPYGIRINPANAARGRGNRQYDKAARAVNFQPVVGDESEFDPHHLLPCASNLILWGANNYAHKLPPSPCWLVWDRKCEKAADSDITDCELAAVIGHRFRTVRIYRHMWAGFQRDSEVGQRVLHPTQKPVSLMRWCLSFFPDTASLVDPYMGSGPVAAAAKEFGLKYVGIEKEECYCETAANRLSQGVLFGKEAR